MEIVETVSTTMKRMRPSSWKSSLTHHTKPYDIKNTTIQRAKTEKKYFLKEKVGIYLCIVHTLENIPAITANILKI